MKARLVMILVLVLVALALPAAAQTEVRTPSPQQIVGAPKGSPLAGAALEAKTKEVASLLRCPTCQGLSIFDSPATMAVNMKAQTRDLLAQGYTKDQILAYFEASYGEFVRLNPKMTGVNWLVWAAPLLLLAGGIWAVVSFLRRSAAREAVAAPQADVATEETIDPELQPYLLRVRELAYGWPGGFPPSEP
jgi:cytochrome c-type biogenesis protein CcmH